MGKYLRKAKVSGEVAVMEVSHHSSLGVRTRARSLAAATAQDSSRAYLELPNRRLEKPLSPHPSCNPSKEASKPNPSPKPDPRASMQKPGPDPRVDLRSPGSVSTSRCSAVAADTEVSFSETVLESGARDSYDRETIPCSLIRDRDPTSRPTISAVTVKQSDAAHEMEEFFAAAEQLQQRIFLERYNFDPVTEHPLPGRYEWVKGDS
ncbi:cyclin-dependent kinase inhibitor [Musa troglodytarum]|uniref:Cyclin-dependent kinase inhibitor n=1 Tax=Musa troglodytarum TaxID=320322 RepID=A0A9E7EV37_9LILI|nr:cyclin-dependent kinase inhibitor [Musa troglodytarum]